MSDVVVKVINNILENNADTYTVRAGITIEDIIRANTTGDEYSSTFVECYDCDTGETFYAPIEEDGETASVAVLVNGKDSTLDYAVAENDVVEVIFLPMSSDSWDWWGALGGLVAGALTGGLYGGALGGGLFSWATAGIGAIIGGVIGFVAGGLITPYVKNLLNPDEKSGNHTKGIDSDNLPDVRGSQNTPLTDNVFPAVMGKHIVTPFIIGSTYNEIYGEHGTELYIHALYLVGYAPLRITDLRLGEQLLAHNQKWSGNDGMQTVFHGRLEGTNSDDDTDLGDIVTTWHSNDIAVEILQQGQNGEEIDWGDIYPYAKIQEDINANVLYIVDKTADEEPLVSYKGVSLANGLRNNPVRFTRQFPKSARIELNFPNGLYKTRSEKSGDDSNVVYRKIPLWVAMQWRVYSNENDTSDGDKSGVISGEMTPTSEGYWWDAENGTQRTAKRGWHPFSYLNGTGEAVSLNFSANGSVTMTQTDYRVPNGNSKDVTVSYSGKVSTTISVDKPMNENAVVSASAEITVICTEMYSYKGHYNSRMGQYETDRWISQSGSHQIPVKAKTRISAVLKAGETSVTVEFPVENKNVWCFYSPKPDYSGVSYEFRDFSVTGYSTTVSGKISNVSFQGDKIADSIDTESYTSTLSSFSFTSLKAKELTRKQGIQVSSYTIALREKDRLAHSGNTITASEYAKLNTKWLNESVFNLEELGGTGDEQEGINEFRVISEVDFVKWARENLTYTDEADFIRKFKAYFFPSSNTTKSIEVRVVRLSPNYLNEIKSTSDNSAYSFNDVFSWKTLTSTMLDDDELVNHDRIVQKRPLSESDMRKHCVIAIKAKTDNTDQIGNTLKKFTCMAQSFAPYYDSEQRQWFPKEVSAVTKYYKPNVVNDDKSITKGAEITEAKFIADRQSGDPLRKSLKKKAGNDFIKNIVTKVIRVDDNKDSQGRYIIPNGYSIGDDNKKIWNDSYITKKDAQGNEVKLWNRNAIRYCENNVASVMLWAGVGAHMGINALSYDDYDMASLARVFEFCKSVTDGSTYNSDGYHYDHEGEAVEHKKGEAVEMYFTANGYIYEAKKFEDVLASLSIAARCVYTRNRANRLTFIIDKKEPYHVALINQANTISSSYSISYADLPSALMIPFKDEDDGYETNNIYAWADGETKDDYRSVIEQYRLDYITNPYHIWSIGRYLLANRIMNREVITKKIGMEGYSIGLGNIVCVQDDTMLIGTDLGGRITELIEDDEFIYGFIINNTYHYTGETDDDGRCKLGVVIMQPSQHKESRVITLRLATLGTTCAVDVNGKPFTVKKAQTNVVVLETRISKDGMKSDGSAVYYTNPKVDNIVGFGEIGKETALYRVLRIKPDNKHNYELTLLKYQPELYEYGRQLPSFQNNITARNESGDNYNLSNAASTTDLVNAVQQASEITVGKSLTIVATEGTAFKNGFPTALPITAVPTGYTPESIQWYKDDEEIEGATDLTLMVTEEGVYRCHAPSLFADFNAYITIIAVNNSGGFQDFQFAVNTSLTEHPADDGEWQDAPPAVGDGEYLWMRTRWVGEDKEEDATEWTYTRISGEAGDGVLVEYSAYGMGETDLILTDDTLLELTNGTNLEVNFRNDWHDTFIPDSDLYMRLSTDNGVTWSRPARIVGEDNMTISVIVSAPNVSVTCDAAGNPLAYDNTDTSIRVYENADELTYDGIGGDNGTWKITVENIGCEGNTVTKYGKYILVGDITKLSIDSAQRRFIISGHHTNGLPFAKAFETTVYQTFSKSKQGVGVSSVLAYTALSNSTTKPAASQFTTATKSVSATNKYLWQYEVTTYTNGDTTGGYDNAVIIGSYGDTGKTGDDGADAISMELTQPVLTYHTLRDGTANYEAYTTTCRLYKGSTQLTEGVTGNVSTANATNITATGTMSGGTYTLTVTSTYGQSAPSGYITATLTYNKESFTKDIAIGSVKSGKYLGGVTALPTSNLALGDYISWLGADTSSAPERKMGFCYAYVCKGFGNYTWVIDNTEEANSVAFSDILGLTTEVSGAPAFIRAQRLAANIAFINNLFANKIKLVAIDDNAGAIYGGERYNADGTLKTRTANGFWLGTSGIFKGNLQGDNGNVLLGEEAGLKLLGVNDKNGSNNVAINYRALSNATSGYGNIAIGAYAGNKITSGSQNVFVGHGAGENCETGSDNIGIGAYAGAEGGKYNILIGNGAGTASTGNFNIGIGMLSLNDAKGSANIGIGAYTGQNITDGQGNIAIGQNSLTSCTTGNGNIAISGSGALRSLKSGELNVAIGYESLTVATGSNNVAIGAAALQNVTTSAQNVAIGVYAGQNLTDGTNGRGGNVFIGYNAGYNIDKFYKKVGNKENNVLIGKSVGIPDYGDMAQKSNSYTININNIIVRMRDFWLKKDDESSPLTPSEDGIDATLINNALFEYGSNKFARVFGVIDYQFSDNYGYIKYANGLLVQWGQVSYSGGMESTNVSIISYMSPNYIVLANPSTVSWNNSRTQVAGCEILSESQFRLFTYFEGVKGVCRWVSVGY